MRDYVVQQLGLCSIVGDDKHALLNVVRGSLFPMIWHFMIKWRNLRQASLTNWWDWYQHALALTILGWEFWDQNDMMGCKAIFWAFDIDSAKGQALLRQCPRWPVPVKRPRIGKEPKKHTVRIFWSSQGRSSEPHKVVCSKQRYVFKLYISSMIISWCYHLPNSLPQSSNTSMMWLRASWQLGKNISFRNLQRLYDSVIVWLHEWKEHVEKTYIKLQTWYDCWHALQAFMHVILQFLLRDTCHSV